MQIAENTHVPTKARDDRSARMTRERSNPAATKLAITWIEGILKKRRMSGSELARRAGLATSTILRLINDPKHEFTPTLKTLQAVSTAVQEPIPEAILRANNIGSSQISRMSQSEIQHQREVMVARAEGRTDFEGSDSARSKAEPEVRMIEVRPVSSLPRSLQPVMKSDKQVLCPQPLRNDKTAFAFYQPDNTLAPFVKEGTLMYATKEVMPSIGDMVLVTSDDGRSRVRVIKDISGEGLVLERAGTFSDTEQLKFTDVEELAVIAGCWRVLSQV